MAEKEYARVTCAHCEGAGCIYCDRTGCVLVAAPPTPCRHCEGAGCIYCGFTGWTHPKGKYD
jgi:DnaJ-class molecular chaperone